MIDVSICRRVDKTTCRLCHCERSEAIQGAVIHYWIAPLRSQ
jgi:hypothetical protein